MWDADDDNVDVRATATHSKSHGFSLDDAFSEDDGVLDAALEFNPEAIRAALARTLAADNDHNKDDEGTAGAGVPDLNPNHDLNGSVKAEDPDASVSTLDINASPAYAPGRAPGEWSRSTSHSHEHGYRQDSQDGTSGMESLANFSRISLSDSLHEIESIEISLEPFEGRVEGEEVEIVDVEEADESLYRAVHIDLSQGGKPRVEELGVTLPEPSNQHTLDRDEARTPSPKPILSPSLPSPSNNNRDTYVPPSTSTPTSNTFQHHQSQGRSVQDLTPQTGYRRSAEDTHTRDGTSHIPPDSARAVLSYGSPGHTPSATASGSIPTAISMASLPNASQSELPKHGGHRHTRSVGPSTLDKVISKTRPVFLPPKPKTEDLKHLADWETMMKQSRAAEKQKRKIAEERRLEREKRAEEAAHIWEQQILPDWKIVHRSPELRKLWWQGIPTSMRGKMWENAVGNPLSLSKDSYRTCLARAKRSLNSEMLALIDADILTTLPNLHLFHPEFGAMYGDLKDMLSAWVISRRDEGLGYVHGVAKIAAMFLLNMRAPEGFLAMRNLLERHCMRAFFGGPGVKDDVEAYYRIFDTLLADAMPKIYFNFKQHQLSPAHYLPDWLIPLFLDHLDINTCAHVWDVLLLEGDSFLFRAALALLAVLEPRLFFPERKELLDLLRGENKAALEVAKRERIPTDGPKYTIYGVDEDVLWDKIESMDGWWKDTTWKRLVLRELPDA